MILVLPFACEPGNARLARVFARAVQRRLAGSRFMPLAAEREGEIHFLNRTDPFEPAELARIGREQGARTVVDGAVAARGGPLAFAARIVEVEVASGKPVHAASVAFAAGELFDAAAAVAGAISGAALAGAKAPPVADLEALALFCEAEEMAMRSYPSAADAAAARARRAALYAEAGRRDARICVEIGDGARPA